MSRRGLGCALVMAALATAVGGAGGAQAQETRAALDPSLVEGRGARVAFAEQEAENAATTGERLSASASGDIASYDPDRRGDEQRAAYTLTGEASGRDAVRLDRGSTSSSPSRERPTRSPSATASPTPRRAAGSARRSRWPSTAGGRAP